MRHWKVTLHGFGQSDFGDVVTKDGEIIGTWSCDENDFYSFTPNGATEPVYVHPMLGLFCSWVAEWHEGAD